MTTPDAAAIEAGAAATGRHSIEFGRTNADGNNPCTCGQWWDGVHGPGWDEHMAEVAYAAMEPHIRKTVAEQIAQAIETHRAALVQTDEWDDGTDSLEAAAKIAREHTIAKRIRAYRKVAKR